MLDELGVALHCRAISSAARRVVNTFLVGTSCLMGVVGCAGPPQPQVAPISGRITYQGKPLPQGQIVFIHSSGSMGAGEIGPDGTYRVMAPVGDCKVMITCNDEPNLSKLSPKFGRPVTLPRSLIPTRYNSYGTSGLKVTLVEGENKRDWELVN